MKSETNGFSRMLEVELVVDHPHLQSAELGRLLTLPADESWDVGQSYTFSHGSSKRYYKFSRWALRSVANSLDELDEAIEILIQRIRGIEQKFHLLPNDATVSLLLFITETDTVFGMGISTELIKLLARINADIQYSLVVSPERD